MATITTEFGEASESSFFEVPHTQDAPPRPTDTRNNNEKHQPVASSLGPDEERERFRLQGRLLKAMRQLCQSYDMLEDGDHLMVCVSGGKDSATLLYLLRHLQSTLRHNGVHIRLTAVHVDQGQPGYNGRPLVDWLQNDLDVPFHIVAQDTYSIVVEKTAPGKTYCSLCSRLRRGILYRTALELGCNKLCLGHHADDALETFLMNLIHTGQCRAMPARYTARPTAATVTTRASEKSSGSNDSVTVPLAVMRPLLTCWEDDIARYAQLSQFPILPCNLCGNQAVDGGQAAPQRPALKILLATLESLTPTAKVNMLQSLQNIRPGHLLDQNLRAACGRDPVTGDAAELSPNVLLDNDNDDSSMSPKNKIAGDWHVDDETAPLW